MKKLIAIITALVTLCATVMGLSSCSKDENKAPSGMKLCMGGAELGYYFYIPEAWNIANQGDIAAAFPSKIAKTSATLVKTEMPSGALGEALAKEKFTKVDNSVITDYFASLSFPYTITVTEGLTATEFGNGDKAWSFVFEYEVEGVKVKVLQYFVEFEDQLYLFTYTSNNAQSFSGESNYEFYFDGVKEIVEAFKFVKRQSGEEKAPELMKDADGYVLFSDPKTSGFSLYAPDSYSVEYSSGAIGINNGRGAELSFTEISYNSLTLEEYVMTRIKSLESIFGDISAKDGKKIENSSDIEAEKLTDRDDCYAIFCYEYRYSYRGVEYGVYQVFIAPERGSFYAMTFTCPATDLDGYRAEIGKILDKIGF